MRPDDAKDNHCGPILHHCTSIMLGWTVISPLFFGAATVLAGHAELDAHTHHRLLLQGRPQVPLYRALLKDAQVQADLAVTTP